MDLVTQTQTHKFTTSELGLVESTLSSPENEFGD